MQKSTYPLFIPLVILLTMVGITDLNGQAKIEIDFFTQKKISGISDLNRNRYFNLHAGLSTFDLGEISYFENVLGVTPSRNVGGITWEMEQIKDDPASPGFPDLSMMASNGASRIASNTSNPVVSNYGTSDYVYTTHPKKFIPNLTQQQEGHAYFVPLTNEGSETFIKNYFDLYFSASSNPLPRYFEVMNEPFVHAGEMQTTPTDLSHFHNDIADVLHTNFPGIKVGGYTAAWPEFERNNFQIWNDNMKLFLDIAGNKMDFVSFHIYDHYDASEQLHARSGSNMEALIDMVEFYTSFLFGSPKPLVISEFGAGGRSWEGQPYTQQRDGKILKSVNAMMMSFLNHPDRIEKAIPFITHTANWFGGPNPYPYVIKYDFGGGDEYTHLLKFYELWQNVTGKRVKTKSNNPDIKSHAFLSGATGWIVIHNHHQTSMTVDLSLVNDANLMNSSTEERRLSYPAGIPVLETSSLGSVPSQVFIGANETIIYKVSLNQQVSFDQVQDVASYIGSHYLDPINSNSPIQHNFFLSNFQECQPARLRLAIGRNHGLSLQPNITVNGFNLNTPVNWTGDNQGSRDQFFGVIEVEVPSGILQANNDVNITFPDSGGFLATAKLEVDHESYATPKQVNFAIDMSCHPDIRDLVDGTKEIWIYSGNNAGNSHLKVCGGATYPAADFQSVVKLSDFEEDCIYEGSVNMIPTHTTSGTYWWYYYQIVDPLSGNSTPESVINTSCAGNTVTDLRAIWVPANTQGFNNNLAHWQCSECPTSCAAALPVEWLDFQVSKDANKGVNLKWSTLSEINTDFFGIEHSTDGLRFSEIGQVEANGNSETQKNYGFYHNNIQKGWHYYRLRQVDLDGRIDYSSIKSIHLEEKSLVQIYPSLTSDYVKVNLKDQDQSLQLDVYNVLGERVLQKSLVNLDNRYDISSWNTGIYVFIVKNKRGKVIDLTRVMVVENP